MKFLHVGFSDFAQNQILRAQNFCIKNMPQAVADSILLFQILAEHPKTFCVIVGRGASYNTAVGQSVYTKGLAVYGGPFFHSLVRV